MKRTNLRKIKVQLTQTEFEEGYFHTWGQAGNVNTTYAIYEREDGSVATTYPECMRFLD